VAPVTPGRSCKQQEIIIRATGETGFVAERRYGVVRVRTETEEFGAWYWPEELDGVTS
jgi:hypothetical protein